MSSDLFEIFVTEGRELTAAVSESLEALLRNGSDSVAKDGLLRGLHTLKGSAGLIGFAPMGWLYHGVEDRLGDLNAKAVTRGQAVALAGVLAQTSDWLDWIAARGQLPPDATAEARNRLAVFQAGGDEDGGDAGGQETEEIPAWARDLASEAGEASGGAVAVRYSPDSDAYYRGEDPLAQMLGLPGLVMLRVGLARETASLATYDTYGCNLVLAGVSSAGREELRHALRLAGDQVEFVQLPAVAAQAGGQAQAAVRTVRVDAARVDALSATVDELVVGKNALGHLVAQAAAALDPALARSLVEAQANLERQISRLHGDVARLRMAPLGLLFRRLPGIARDTAAQLGKSVDVRISGSEIELDKSVADGLFEPLMHLIRNAVDHGVETPDIRRAAGKSDTPILDISARTHRDEVIITVRDDGRGLDLEAIRKTAISRRLTGPAKLDGLTDEQTIELLFRPGFSTAASVTEVSGRGVGLDAVRNAVESLGGKATLSRAPGGGTLAELRLPVNVQLTKLMVVQAGGERYAIPVEAVLETCRLTADEATPLRGGQAVMWRDHVLPLLPLAELTGGTSRLEPSGERRVLVVRSRAAHLGLVVTDFDRPTEASVRPATGLLGRLPAIAGTTIAGDGSVLLVLDPEGLIP